jgi:transposase, IS6 family
MMGERGVAVDHTTVYRWTQRYAPELEKRSAWYRSRLSFSWRVDETYVRVKGALEVPLPRDRQRGCDARLLPRRPAQRQGGQAVSGQGTAAQLTPRVINTEKNPAYGEAIAELKKEGLLPKDTQHRQVKYLNNRLEGDHGKLKRLIRPTLGFQSMKTAYATIKGFEVMRMFKKGQFAPWIDAICGGT